VTEIISDPISEIVDALDRALKDEDSRINRMSVITRVKYLLDGLYRQPLQPVPEPLPQGGPISNEYCTLDQLLDEMLAWKRVAGGNTCVSFENLCYGSASLWHQTHRENFRKVDQKPEALSRWVLTHEQSVNDDFPAQVLEILQRQQAEIATLKSAVPEPSPWLDQPDGEGCFHKISWYDGRWEYRGVITLIRRLGVLTHEITGFPFQRREGIKVQRIPQLILPGEGGEI
jgi:hypothetical protein